MSKTLTRMAGTLALQLAGCAGVTGEGSIQATGGSDGTLAEVPQGGATGTGQQSGGNSNSIGATNTGGSSTGAATTAPNCAVPGCCAPLAFDPVRSRAYEVNGQLALYLVVTAADGSTAPVQFDAQVSLLPGGVPHTCVGSQSWEGYGFGYVECPAITATDLACGAALSIQVRLHGAQTDSTTLSPRCDPVEFGPSVTWNATVACPSCPSDYISMGASCDHPSISNCSNFTYGDVHCGSITLLPCRCVTSYGGIRTWNCAIC